jgi:tetratricopeptide (TPR) repeat protein
MRLFLAVLCAIGLLWGGWAWWTDQRYHRAMDEIESDVMGERYATACRKLEKLLSWKGDRNGGIVYLLGSCELARGRYQAAGAAWARVPPGSAFSERAIRGRVRLLVETGQPAEAEQLVKDAARERRNDRTGVLLLLVPLYTSQGRLDEARRLIEDRWEHLNQLGEGALEPAVKLLLQHIELTWKRAPVETDPPHLRYEQLFARKQPLRDAVEMARLAERLGRAFEARGFLTLAIADDPRREDLRRDLQRLSQRPAVMAGSSGDAR